MNQMMNEHAMLFSCFFCVPIMLFGFMLYLQMKKKNISRLVSFKKNTMIKSKYKILRRQTTSINLLVRNGLSSGVEQVSNAGKMLRQKSSKLFATMGLSSSSSSLKKKVSFLEQAERFKEPQPVPYSDTLFGSAPLSIWWQGYTCPSDFLDLQKKKYGAVFKFPCLPFIKQKGQLSPIFVTDPAAMAQLRPNRGFERSSIAEDAAVSNLNMPLPTVPMKEAGHDEVLYRVYRSLVTQHRERFTTELIEELPGLLDRSMLCNVAKGVSKQKHENLHELATRTMFMSFSSVMVNAEFGSEKKDFQNFYQYVKNFPKILMMQKLGFGSIAEKLRKPLYDTIARLTEIRASYSSEEEYFLNLKPLSQSMYTALKGPLGKRFHVANDGGNRFHAVSTILPMFGALINTGTTFSWILQCILQDRKVQYVIEEEIRSKVKPGTDCIDYLKNILTRNPDQIRNEFIKEFPKLNSVILEASRMSTAVMVMFETTHDTTLEWNDSVTGKKCGPFSIKKGELLVAPSLNVHYDQTIYKNPSTFKWDRFMPEKEHPGRMKVHKTPNGTKATIMIWGHGTKVCPGKRIALDALTCVLVTLFANYDLKLDDNAPKPSFNLEEWGIGAMAPNSKVPLTVTKISSN